MKCKRQMMIYLYNFRMRYFGAIVNLEIQYQLQSQRIARAFAAIHHFIKPRCYDSWRVVIIIRILKLYIEVAVGYKFKPAPIRERGSRSASA